MAKPWDKDFRFMIKATIAAAFIVGVFNLLFYSYDPVAYQEATKSESIGTTPATPAQIEEFQDRLITFDPVEFPKILKAQKTPKTVLYIYASWCPYCRKLTPKMIELKHHLDPKEVEIIFLSIDENPEKLVKYLLNQNMAEEFIPYISVGPMLPMMNSLGAQFDGHIPYIGVFDHKAKTLTVSLGNNNFEAIKKATGANY